MPGEDTARTAGRQRRLTLVRGGARADVTRRRPGRRDPAPPGRRRAVPALRWAGPWARRSAPPPRPRRRAGWHVRPDVAPGGGDALQKAAVPLGLTICGDPCSGNRWKPALADSERTIRVETSGGVESLRRPASALAHWGVAR